MRPTALSLVAGLATVAALLIATSGSAQAPPPAPTTLHLVGKAQAGVGFFPKGRPRQGDRYAFGNKVSGSDTGISRGLCTDIGAGRNSRSLCTEVDTLSKGTLVLEGLVNGRPRGTRVAVTGGTGAYDGARGTAIVTELGRGKTDFKITLLP